MSFAGGWLLPGAALATSLLHTLIPDHWLPFVLIGRARRWTPGKTAIVSGISAAIHAVLSVALGFVALRIGREAAAAAGDTLERASGVLLVLFGVGYAVWAWRKRGHFHPGGAKIHAIGGAEGCDGDEGPSHPEHMHYHADDRLIRGRERGAAFLALIVGLNPCVLVLPLLIAAADGGPWAIALVTAGYVIPTVGLMVGLSAAGVAGARRIRLPAPARYMEAASGLLIAAVGVVFLLIE